MKQMTGIQQKWGKSEKDQKTMKSGELGTPNCISSDQTHSNPPFYQNVVAEATIQDHAKGCLALKWVAQRQAGIPENQITYHPHRHVRRFINEGWEELGRREEERWREREAEKRGREEERERRERQREKEEKIREERAKTERQKEEEQQKIEKEWRQLIRRRERKYLKDCQEAGFKLKKD